MCISFYDINCGLRCLWVILKDEKIFNNFMVNGKVLHCTYERAWFLFKSIFIFLSLYSLIWDFLLSQINKWTTTTWSNVWVILPKPTCDFMHVLVFVIVSKCRKNPKLTNIVILKLMTIYECKILSNTYCHL